MSIEISLNLMTYTTWSWADHYSYMPRMRSALLQKHGISVDVGHDYMALKFSIVFYMTFWVYRRAQGVYQKHNLSRQIHKISDSIGVGQCQFFVFWVVLAPHCGIGSPSHEEPRIVPVVDNPWTRHQYVPLFGTVFGIVSFCIL